MNHDILRRGFLTRSIAIAASALAAGPATALAAGEVKRRAGIKIKLGLNSYSFNRPLMAGQMTPRRRDRLLRRAQYRRRRYDRLLLPGYPKVPADEYLYNLKKKAYLNGVTISGTGVRNDFTLADAGSPQGADHSW